MEIILSKQCESITGSLGQGFGYFIVNRKGRFYSVRSKHSVPYNGHWLFIVACAELAQSKFHVADIEVSGFELMVALNEAFLIASALSVDLDHVYSARDVLNFKSNLGL